MKKKSGLPFRYKTIAKNELKAPKIDKSGSIKIIKIAKTGFFPINKNL